MTRPTRLWKFLEEGVADVGRAADMVREEFAAVHPFFKPTEHDLEADGIEDCVACMEIVTDPNERNEMKAHSRAESEHFRQMLGDDRYTTRPEDFVRHFR